MTSESPHALPWLIQGGMGIAISGWQLAQTVSRAGQLGVVSGTAINGVFVRRLQDDGIDETLGSILSRFPDQRLVDDVVEHYGTRRRDTDAPYRNVPMLTVKSSARSIGLVVLAAFVEVALAKEGHDGIVGMNLLTKVQIPTVPSLYGAMLAGVDYVLMGAGVPTHIPGLLDRLAIGDVIDLPLQIVGDAAPSQPPLLHFDPTMFGPRRDLTRPKFIGIVSSHVLASALAKRSSGSVEGFVVERPSAGGHNAPPRGRFELDDEGNPLYGERDHVDYDAMRALDLPFWIGGSITSREDVVAALELGATGVQVGTLFAYCRESGFDPTLRHDILERVRHSSIHVTTSMTASPTGYPFKVAQSEGSISETAVYDERERKCDLGFLRDAYTKDDGTLGYRCPAEPADAYVKKGGLLADTLERTCLCNGLMATCGLGQVRSDGRHEPPIITSGDCIDQVRTLLGSAESYGALDVMAHLLPTG